MVMVRKCSRNACRYPAVATLTFDYKESTAVLGPLAPAADPGAYDMCAEHAKRLTVPNGWQIIRVPIPSGDVVSPDQDDLAALADSIRKIGLGLGDDEQRSREIEAGIVELNRRGHLRVIADGAYSD